jgi:hypothetical protein
MLENQHLFSVAPRASGGPEPVPELNRGQPRCRALVYRFRGNAEEARERQAYISGQTLNRIDHRKRRMHSAALPRQRNIVERCRRLVMKTRNTDSNPNPRCRSRTHDWLQARPPSFPEGRNRGVPRYDTPFGPAAGWGLRTRRGDRESDFRAAWFGSIFKIAWCKGDKISVILPRMEPKSDDSKATVA